MEEIDEEDTDSEYGEEECESETPTQNQISLRKVE